MTKKKNAKQLKKVAVNTRLLLKDEMDGIGLFTFESFKRIVANHPEIEFTFIFDRKPHPDFIFSDNVKTKVLSPPTKHIYLFNIWYQLLLPQFLKKLNPALFIATDGMIPLKSATKTLAVIHDLNFEHYPAYLPKNVARYYQNNFRKFAKKSTRIATVSEYSKQDICTQYSINENKIDVVYNGANENFKPISDTEKQIVRDKYSHGVSYFLFVGTLHPRKNLINLFKAFDEFKSQTNSDIKLLVVGKKMWWTNEIKSTYQQLKYQSDVIFTGRVSENDLYKITASAFALTYVPIFEGFGIPLVESMNCGVPIVTSNVTSMPEIVNNAAILVDPFSVQSITEGMVKIYSDENLRNELIQKGLQRAKEFSWEKTAHLLWESALKTIQG